MPGHDDGDDGRPTGGDRMPARDDRNGVNLGDQLGAFGVDAVRLTLVFAGPPEDDIDWANMSPEGSLRFLQRAWRLSGDVTSPAGADITTGDLALRRTTARTVHDAAELVEAYRFNVMVARVMELVNADVVVASQPDPVGPVGTRLLRPR